MIKSKLTVLAVVASVLATPVFAMNLGGVTIQPQQSKHYDLRKYNINMDSLYSIDCTATLPASAKSDVPIKFSAITEGVGAPTHFDNGVPPSTPSGGTVLKGTTAAFGTMNQSPYADLVIINASEDQPITVDCKAKMS